MPKFKVPVVVKTMVEVDAESGSCAEDAVNEMVAKLFPSEDTRFETDTPIVKSAYEVTVTFYMDAFSTEEVEDRVCNIVRRGSGNEIGIGFDIEAIKQGGPCRG